MARSNLSKCLACGRKKACGGPVEVYSSPDVEDCMTVRGARCGWCHATQTAGAVIQDRRNEVSLRSNEAARTAAVKALEREADAYEDRARHFVEEAERARRIARELDY